MSATYEYVAGNNSLQWLLLYPWASQQLSHFWISKEPDELHDRPLKGFTTLLYVRQRFFIFTFLSAFKQARLLF